MQLSFKLIDFAHKVSKIPFAKALLKPFYYPYKRRVEQSRLKAIRQNGLSVLFDFDKAMTMNGIHYSVFAGTLLGAIREKGFIKHDLDIDTAIWAEDYSPNIQKVLEEDGFKLTRSFLAENGQIGREETYVKCNVDIDIFYIYKDEQGRTYNCGFHPLPDTSSWFDSMKKYGRVGAKQFRFPLEYDIKRAPFETIEVNVPQNAEVWLAARYGEDFMLPNPNFVDKQDNENIVYLDNIEATFIAY